LRNPSGMGRRDRITGTAEDWSGARSIDSAHSDRTTAIRIETSVGLGRAGNWQDTPGIRGNRCR
jgi:hypothetical protein